MRKDEADEHEYLYIARQFVFVGYLYIHEIYKYLVAGCVVGTWTLVHFERVYL